LALLETTGYVSGAFIMSLGAWLLLIFLVLSFAYFYLWLPDRFDIVDCFDWFPTLDGWLSSAWSGRTL